MGRKKNGEVAAFRKKAGWTQDDLARRVKVDRSLISRWEDGSVVPTLSGFRSMREAYGVPSDELDAALLAVRRRYLRRNSKPSRNGQRRTA
jgi:transcriptional regulator with XRE-family HTH domain